MKKDDKKTLIVVIAVCLICVLIIFLTSRKSNFDKLSIVKDYGAYFSVINEVNSYVGYVSIGDKNNIINLLDNSADVDSIVEHSNYSTASVFSCNDIEFVKIGNDYLYLARGKIVENNFEDSTIIDDNYLVVVLNDISNNSYSIYPVNEDNYKKVINGIRKINIDSNSVNKMIKSDNFTDVQICKLYFSSYISKLYNNVNNAYELISDDMKKRFSSYEEFSKYINDNMSKITSSSKLCNMDEYKDSRVYTVIDNNDNSYSFSENGVMNYKVNFYFKSDEE